MGQGTTVEVSLLHEVAVAAGCTRRDGSVTSPSGAEMRDHESSKVTVMTVYAEPLGVVILDDSEEVQAALAVVLGAPSTSSCSAQRAESPSASAWYAGSTHWMLARQSIGRTRCPRHADGRTEE